jgi:transcriptional regulator with XRE-family HTH domain
VDNEKRAIKNLSKRVLHLRTAKGWTQERCAEEARIATAYLSGVERGVRNPTVKVLARLAAAFGVKIGQLFDNTLG